MRLSIFFALVIFLYTWLGFGLCISQASSTARSCEALLDGRSKTDVNPLKVEAYPAFEKLFSQYKKLEADFLSGRAMDDIEFAEKRQKMARVMWKILHENSYLLEEMVLEKKTFSQNFVIRLHEVAFNFQKLIPIEETIMNPFLNQILEKASRLLLLKNGISFREIPKENSRETRNLGLVFEIRPTQDSPINRLASQLQSKFRTRMIYDFSFLRNRSSAVQIETGDYFIDLRGMLEPNKSEYVPHEVLHARLAFQRRQGQDFLLDGILIDHAERNSEISNFIFDEIPGYGITIRVLLQKIIESKSLALIPVLKGAIRRARQYSEKVDSISTEFMKLAKQKRLTLRRSTTPSPSPSPSPLKSWELYHGGRVILWAHGRTEVTMSEAVGKLGALKVYAAEKSRTYNEIDLAIEEWERHPTLESFEELADYIRSQKLR